jgi:putative membrane protein
MAALIAHVGQVGPHDLAAAWPIVPAVWLLLAAATVVYVRGVRRLRGGEAGRRATPGWRVGCAAAALGVSVVALASPLEPLTGTLFTAHMFQHELLVLLLAPLLVLSRPVLVGSLALPPRWRSRALMLRWRRPARLDTVALVTTAVLLHAVTLWVWHVPVLYEGALASDAVHVVEHVTMTVGAVPLWWLAVDARGRRTGAPVVLGLLVAAIQASILAGMLTFAGEPLYDLPTAGLAAWGMTAIEDQQAAGGMMWFPGGLTYVIAGSAAFLRWLRSDEELRRHTDRSPTTDAVRGARP